ncbi:AMP-binding protein [Kitasatospora sp. NPDC050467]|uniref:AMP-binding protein n=1 Tax=Kitasatospora sp. NPDC050467 TaxID=3364053 RepID=UPI00379CA7BC
MGGPSAHTLAGRFLRGLALSPQRAAFRAGAETRTYEHTHELALRWAGSLLAAADGRPAAVGVLAGKGVTAYTGILAALYAGAAVVPLRPDFPQARTRAMLDAAPLSAVIADGPGSAALPGLLGPGGDVPVLVPDDAVLGTGLRRVAVRDRHTLDAPVAVRPEDRAYLLFTSGSTGRPKGVPLTHGNTSHYFDLLDRRYDFSPDDVFSQTFDLNFDCSLFDLFCAWGAGATAQWIPPQGYRDLPGYLAEHRMTVWFSTPSGISLARRTGALAPGALPGLRWSFFAGEALKCQDTADWQQAAPGSVVENLYGPTEFTVTIAAHRWDPELSPGLAVNGVVPIGAVHEGHAYELLDADGRVVADEGELCVSGPQMAPGYLDPADAAGRFVERDGRTWYLTGDRVRRVGDPAGGQLAYLGRMDAQVQLQGWRVELAEIDHALSTVEGVTEAVTVDAVTDDGIRLVVFYTGPEAVRPAAFAKQLGEVLPQGLLPKRYVLLGEMPLNANRKVDRKELRNRAGALIAAGKEGGGSRGN